MASWLQRAFLVRQSNRRSNDRSFPFLVVPLWRGAKHMLSVAILAGVGVPAAANSGDWLADEPLGADALASEVRVPLERRQIDVAEVGARDVSFGVYTGLLSVADFGVDQVSGAQASIHVTEDFFLEGTYARGQLGLTSFELLSGGAPILRDDERDLQHYGVNLGWDVLPGEAFLGSWAAVNTSLYVIGGVGSTQFAGDDRFTVTYGVGYRMVAADWLALHIDVRDHLFETDLLGTNKMTHNVEFRTGFTLFF